MLIVRNSFIQMSKLTNVKGRISYISSHARQENLYAVYETTDRKFWKELANCNQEEFKKSGTKGNCIEARELIIALPESFVEYEPSKLLQLFTEYFKQTYGTECIAALHHNKRKTNYHIHLIFAERKLLEQPIEKIATRNMFYDETGKHVRTKKEILDETGQLRQGCKIIPKGEVYERNIFTVKDSRFKSENFLNEVKYSYTNLINIYVKDKKEQQKVFEKNGVYLPTKKIGKNNPKAEQIEEDNQMRVQWNQAVDRALISGISEELIMEVKQKEIGEKVRTSIQQFGENPKLLKGLIMIATNVLELLVDKKLKESIDKTEDVAVAKVIAEEKTKIEEENIHKSFGEEEVLEQPVKSELASKYPRLMKIFRELEKHNEIIYNREQELASLEKRLVDIKGIFKGKQRKELQEQIEQLKLQVNDLKRYLTSIVQDYGYKNVKEFMTEYKLAKEEYDTYKLEVAKWEQKTGNKIKENTFKERLQQKQQEIKEQDSKRESYYKNDRSSR